MNGSAVVLGICYYLTVSERERESSTLFYDVETHLFSFLQTLVTDITGYAALLLPMTCALCLVSSVLTAAMTKVHSEDDDRGGGGAGGKKSGTLLGLNMAVHSVIRTAAPTVGGHLVASYGFESVGYLGVACNLAVLVLLTRTTALHRTKKEKRQ